MTRRICLLLALLLTVASAARAGIKFETETLPDEARPARNSIAFSTQSIFPLRQGQVEGPVRAAQRRLSELGFGYGLPDGVYGARTASAVKAVQRHLNRIGYDLAVDGEVNEDLYRLLASDAFPEGEEALRSGDKGERVSRLQRRLVLLGYLDSATDAYGERTREAVAAFQARNALEPDGVASAQTLARLYSAVAVPAQAPLHEKLVYVSTLEQRVYVYQWGARGYEGPIRTFVCSTGKAGNATITGVFRTEQHCGEWYWFKDYAVWAKYAIRISGPYLFHSTLYSSKSESARQQSSIRALGTPASHGCIRMNVNDIRWMYDNTDEHFTTIIY